MSILSEKQVKVVDCLSATGGANRISIKKVICFYGL